MPIIQVSLNATAVQFEFMNEARGCGQLGPQRGQGGFDEAGLRGGFRVGQQTGNTARLRAALTAGCYAGHPKTIAEDPPPGQKSVAVSEISR
jgi:hypothetical protein